MAREPELECPCLNDSCERRTHCEDCFAHHEPMPKPAYCLRDEVDVRLSLLERVDERYRAWEAARDE